MAVELAPGFALRHARRSDHDALCDVCLKTGDSGADATGREDDPRLIGQIWTLPYQVLEPDFAFVIEDRDGVAGYVLGTPDTRRFDALLEEKWFPALRRTIRDPGQDETTWRGSDWARHRIHHMEYVFPPSLHPYPAQAHIDLLPRAQGRGVGWRAMTFIMARLAAAGAPGLHLHVSPANLRAQRFYAKLGFMKVEDPAFPLHTVFMTRALP
jgi:RimJ/RimL family protein N-acetyltransferase